MESDPMKLVWLTDLHFDTAPAWGVDLDARLNAAIDHIIAHQSDAAYCMVTGDLTNDGDGLIGCRCRGCRWSGTMTTAHM